VASLLRNWRVLGALLLASGLVIGAYAAARSGSHPRVAEASTETALLQQIATQDSDGDGLPDWEESLYGTDPHLVDSKSLGMTDGEAVIKGLIVPKAVADIPAPAAGATPSAVVDGVPAPAPGSLTDVFAKNFLVLYLNAKQANGGAALSEQDTTNLAQKAVNQLTSSIAPVADFKSMADLAISGSGPDALRTFAVVAEAVMSKNTVSSSKSELLYLQDAIQNKDEAALAHITSIAGSYRATAAGLSVLPVPRELASDYLVLINALARVGEIATDFSHVTTDPLATMLALTQYPQTVLVLANSFIHIHDIYKAAGIEFAPGTPGASFVNVIPDIAASQKAEAAQPQP
jgi:hypothetical protein